MISTDRTNLLKKTSSYYKNRNKTRLLQKQINFIKSKQDGPDNY